MVRDYREIGEGMQADRKTKKKKKRLRIIPVPYWATAIGTLASDYQDVIQHDHSTMRSPAKF